MEWILVGCVSELEAYAASLTARRDHGGIGVVSKALHEHENRSDLIQGRF